jgi:hypothetical protein
VTFATFLTSILTSVLRALPLLPGAVLGLLIGLHNLSSDLIRREQHAVPQNHLRWPRAVHDDHDMLQEFELFVGSHELEVASLIVFAFDVHHAVIAYAITVHEAV